MPEFDVIACGINVVDNILVLPEVVRRNEKHEIARMLIQGGGPGANQACGLAALGWRTAMLTKHGDNLVSRIAETEFVRHGVSLDFVIRAPRARPAFSVVEVDPRTGERTVFYNLEDYDWIAASEVPEAAVQAARLVITDGYEAAAALRMLQMARDAHIPGVLDIETGEAAKVRPLYAAASHVIVSLEGGRQTTGCESPADVLGVLSGWTDAQLVITDGIHGCWALGPDGVIHQPAFPVAAVDSTGCGDSFHAAYASALLDGFPLPERVEFAAWTASFVALALGARTNLPSRAKLRVADQSRLSPSLRALMGKRF